MDYEIELLSNLLNTEQTRSQIRNLRRKEGQEDIYSVLLKNDYKSIKE